MSIEEESVLFGFSSSVGYTHDDVGETGEGFEDCENSEKSPSALGGWVESSRSSSTAPSKALQLVHRRVLRSGRKSSPS